MFLFGGFIVMKILVVSPLFAFLKVTWYQMSIHPTRTQMNAYIDMDNIVPRSNIWQRFVVRLNRVSLDNGEYILGFINLFHDNFRINWEYQ